MTQHAYLDSNATTRPADEVIEAMAEVMRHDWANTLSIHRPGQAAAQRVEEARGSLAALFGCAARELTFTSGATESCNAALRGILEAQPVRRTLITTRIEHSAVRQPAERLAEQGCNVLYLNVDTDGVVDLDHLAALLEEHGDDVALVAVIWVNNETGVIQPIEEIGRLCRERGVFVFTDGTQAVGKLPIDLEALPVDAMAFSAHKFYGPTGVGGLYLRRRTPFVPQQRGGTHERERRAGTINAAGVVGMAVAADLAARAMTDGTDDTIKKLRDRFEQTLLTDVKHAVVIGAGARRVWNTSNIAFPPLAAEAIIVGLSERGVYASAGAACLSGSLDPSPVLMAMGLPDPITHAAIRFSFSRYTTEAEVDFALATIPEVLGRLAAAMPGT